MSREVHWDDRCAFKDCGAYRQYHDPFTTASRVGQMHAFVEPEPARAEAPQRCARVVDGDVCGEVETEPPHGKMSGHKFEAPQGERKGFMPPGSLVANGWITKNGVGPAAQPETGGDEGRVREKVKEDDMEENATGPGDAVDIAHRHWDKLVKSGGDQLDYVTLDEACVEAFDAGGACAPWCGKQVTDGNIAGWYINGMPDTPLFCCERCRDLYAAGRAAENEAREKLIRDAVVEASMVRNGKLAKALHLLADAIAARRGGGG